MWEWFGMLFGICIRTGVRLGLELPPFFWKPLSGLKLSKSDLYNVDTHTCEVLDIIQECDRGSFEEAIQETFCTIRSDRYYQTSASSLRQISL